MRSRRSIFRIIQKNILFKKYYFLLTFSSNYQLTPKQNEGLNINQKGEGPSDLLPPLAEDANFKVAPDPPGTTLDTKSEPHDIFDSNSLLEIVPEAFQKRAKELLEKIHEHSMDISFSTNGAVFIDGKSIPNADIKIIFPALFIRKNKTAITGLKETATKLASLGLGHLFFKGILKSLKRPANYKFSDEDFAVNYKKHHITHWWFIG